MTERKLRQMLADESENCERSDEEGWQRVKTTILEHEAVQAEKKQAGVFKRAKFFGLVPLLCAGLAIVALIAIPLIKGGGIEQPDSGTSIVNIEKVKEVIINDLNEVEQIYGKTLNIENFEPAAITLYVTDDEKRVPVYFEILYSQIEVTPFDLSTIRLTVFLVENHNAEKLLQQAFPQDSLKYDDYETGEGPVTIGYNETSETINPGPDDLIEYKLYSKFKAGNCSYYIEGSYFKLPQALQEMLTEIFPEAVFIENLLEKLLKDLLH